MVPERARLSAACGYVTSDGVWDVVPHDVRARVVGARKRIRRRMRRALFGDQPSWRRQPDVMPWFDQPDAMAALATRARTRQEAALLTQWIRDGYVILDDTAPAADVDAMVATLDRLWDAPTPTPCLELLDLRERPDAPVRTLSHAALLALDPATRARMRAASNWRIHGFPEIDPAARRLFRSPRLRQVASLLFGRPARPLAAINFMAGSEQAPHQDMAVFHIHPRNHLLGAWIACEDIAPDSGPLVVYPGSHRTPFFPGFADYPQTNLRTVDSPTQLAYRAYVDALLPGFARREFLARKGQVLFWHGMLIHGGAPVARRGAPRRSMVVHYGVRGADRRDEVRGPFNW